MLDAKTLYPEAGDKDWYGETHDWEGDFSHDPSFVAQSIEALSK